MENKLLAVSSSPHIRAEEDTKSIMLDVIIALIPAFAVAVYVFGLRAMLLTLISVAACVFFEYLYRKLLKKPGSVSDLSAVVTGILLAFCLPSSAPFWLPIPGAFFAIVVVKQLYGGIGKNFLNPALAGRAFLLSWPVLLTKWQKPFAYDSVFNFSPVTEPMTGATPLASLHTGVLPDVSLYDMFYGYIGGCLGEVSVAALLIGGIYLLLRRVISARIPLAFILTVAVLTFLFPRGNDRLDWMLYQLTSGGLMLGAVFMATDYCTSPVTKPGQLIFGIGCGLITVFIRYFGSYPEGVSFSILVMNILVWLLDKGFLPRRFGVAKGGGKK